MRITLELDLDKDLAIVPFDLLGDISLEHLDRSISDEICSINNWFDCFVDACSLISKNGVYEIELLTEPDPIIFKVSDSHADISYRAESIVNVPVDSFSRAVQKSGLELIQSLKKVAPEYDLLDFEKLAVFLSKNKQ